MKKIIRLTEQDLQKLIERVIKESSKDKDEMSFEDDEKSDFENDEIDDFDEEDYYRELGLDFEDEAGGDEYENLNRKKYREFFKKKFRPMDIGKHAKRWSSEDDKYKPFSPIKPTDMNLSDYLKSKEK